MRTQDRRFLVYVLGVGALVWVLSLLTPLLGDLSALRPAFAGAFGVGAMVVLGSLYFMPAIIAHRLNHPQTVAITVLNIFAGWTIIAWVAALVWSVTKQRTAP